MPAKTAVVLLCWNGRTLLERFLPPLLKHRTSEEIIVADNGSTDDSISFLEKNYPQVTRIALGKNFGFAAGYNEVMSRINHEYVVLLNQDVEVTAGWLQPLTDLLDADEHVGAVQPVIHSWARRNEFEYAGAAGGWIDRLGYPFCRGRIFDRVEIDEGQYQQAVDLFWASGACLLTRRKLYIDAGGLDADFFAHMEEIDFCWRIKNAGWRIAVCTNARVYHVGAASLSQHDPFKTYLNFRNSLALLAKNLHPKKLLHVLVFRILLDQVGATRFLLRGEFGHWKAVWKAQLHFIFRWRSWIKKRRPPFLPLENMTGVYSGSIVWEYFIRKKKTFSLLLEKK